MRLPDVGADGHCTECGEHVLGTIHEGTNEAHTQEVHRCRCSLTPRISQKEALILELLKENPWTTALNLVLLSRKRLKWPYVYRATTPMLEKGLLIFSLQAYEPHHRLLAPSPLGLRALRLHKLDQTPKTRQSLPRRCLELVSRIASRLWDAAGL